MCTGWPREYLTVPFTCVQDDPENIWLYLSHVYRMTPRISNCTFHMCTGWPRVVLGAASWRSGRICTCRLCVSTRRNTETTWVIFYFFTHCCTSFTQQNLLEWYWDNTNTRLWEVYRWLRSFFAVINWPNWELYWAIACMIRYFGKSVCYTIKLVTGWGVTVHIF